MPHPKVMTHRATIDADRLRTALISVAAIAEEARYTVGETGMRLAAVEPNGTAFATAFLHPAAFDGSKIPKSVTVGVSLGRLVDAVDHYDPTTGVILTIDPDNYTLSITDDRLTTTLGLLDPDTVAAPPDSTGMTSQLRASLDGAALGRAVEACRMVYAGDASDGDDRPTADLVIGTDPDGGVFAEAHGDTDDAYVELPLEERTDPGEQPIRASYPLATLRRLTRTIQGDTRVDLRFGPDGPLGIEWAFANGAGEVHTEVAPIVDHETSDQSTGQEPTIPATDEPPLPPGVDVMQGTVRVRAGHLDNLFRLLADGSNFLAETERLEIVTESGDVIGLTADGGRLSLDGRDQS